jgi:hypothetical protein
MSSDERKQILEMIASGAISASQGLALLNALGDDEVETSPAPAGILSGIGAPPESTPAADTDVPIDSVLATGVPTGTQPPVASFSSESVSEPVLQPTVEDAPPEPAKAVIPPPVGRWRSWWRIPLAIGVVITVASAALMYSAWQASHFGFWFACSWFPFMLGVLFIAIAWTSRQAVWLHVRIRQRPGERPANINISLPIPIHLTSWLVRVFRPHIPGMENIPGIENGDLDTLLQALKSTSRDQPFYVEVNDEDGEHVEIFIG